MSGSDAGKASAIPENLISYSDQCTRASQDVLDFVRSTLGPAASDFYRNCGPREDAGVNVDTSAAYRYLGGSGGGLIDEALARQLSAANSTDHQVRKVGLAFQEAGGHGSLASPKNPVHTTDDVISKGLARYDAGAAAAKLFPQRPAVPNGDDAAVSPGDETNPGFVLLYKNAGDPEFCAGLLQAGGPRVVEQLLLSLTDGQFEYNLMKDPDANGQADTTTPVKVVNEILKNGLADPDVVAALKAPAVPGDGESGLALAVASALNADQAEQPEGVRWQAWQTLLPVLTNLVREVKDPQLAQQLVTEVGKSIPEDFSADDLKKLMPELNAFMSAGVGQSVTPPPPGTNLNVWASNYGSTVSNEIAPYLQALKAADISQNDRNALIRSMVQGAYLNLLPLPGESLAADAFNGALQSWMGAKDPTDTLGLGKVLKDHNEIMDVVTTNNLIDAKAGQFALISTLVDKGYLRDPNPDQQGHYRPLKLTGGPADADLISQIAANPNNYVLLSQPGKAEARLSDVEKEQLRAGTAPTVAGLLNDFNQGAGYINPNSKMYTLLTDKN